MQQTSEKKKFILIAEDDNFYASIYHQRLSDLGYEVSVVPDGEQLMKLIKSKIPDLVMLDLIMPKLDGFETLRMIKEDPKLNGIRVLILSNLAQKEDVDTAMQLGAIGYIVKSNTSIHDVLAKVKDSIG